MNASKETARGAFKALQRLYNKFPREEAHTEAADVKLLEDFLVAAERRLPTEKAIEADRDRRKCKKF